MCLTPVVRNYCFFGFSPLTPLIVATAPLFLPYILRCKTQGRRNNTNSRRNKIGYRLFSLLIADEIGECP